MQPIPELFRIEEVAKKLHKSKRWLQDFLRFHPCGRRAGRTLLFTAEDVTYLINELPRQEQRLVKIGPLNHAPRTLDRTSKELLERLAAGKRKCKPPPRKRSPDADVVTMPRRPRPTPGNASD
jgi:hypothetical protein